MTSDTRPRPLQLELTLLTPPTRATPRPDDDWRLDEATRCIGRRGVAAARALLTQGNLGRGTGAEDRSTHGIDADVDGGRAGRAA